MFSSLFYVFAFAEPPGWGAVWSMEGVVAGLHLIREWGLWLLPIGEIVWEGTPHKMGSWEGRIFPEKGENTVKI